jgi:hypothetical protein
MLQQDAKLHQLTCCSDRVFSSRGVAGSNCVVKGGQGMESKAVAIRVQLSETLRARFKAQCALKSQSMNEVVVQLIEQWLADNQA